MANGEQIQVYYGRQRIMKRKDPLFDRGRARIDVNGGGATTSELQIKAQWRRLGGDASTCAARGNTKTIRRRLARAKLGHYTSCPLGNNLRGSIMRFNPERFFYLLVLIIFAGGCSAGLPSASTPVVRLVDGVEDFEDLLDDEEREEEAERERRNKRRSRRKYIDRYGEEPDRARPGARTNTDSDESTRQWGLRSGRMIFGSADFREPDGGRLVLGGFLRTGRTSSRMVEIAIEAALNSDDASGENLLIGRANFLWFPAGPHWYVEIGGGAMDETYNSHNEQTGFGEAGMGVLFPLWGREWDVRASWLQLTASENVQDLIVISAGLGF